MIVTIHQPDFLPWLGFFDRWEKSDLYIILDDVQFLRRGWHHRDKIKNRDGAGWITVPVNKKGKYNQLIRDTKIDNSTDWRSKHLKAIEMNYKKAPNFEYYFNKIKNVYDNNHLLLIDLNIELLKFCASILQIETPFIFSSSFQETSKGTQRIVNLVKAVEGNVYLTGLGSRDYLDEALFNNEGIKVYWQEFNHPVYPQRNGNFKKMLSILDFLMMVPTPKKVFKGH